MENDSEFLKKNLSKMITRAESARALETKNEFTQQLYPFLEALLEVFDGRVSDLEAVVAELAEQADPTETVIEPEFTAKIATVLAIGGRLVEVAALLSERFGDQLDDMTKKRITELLENKGTLKDWIDTYRTDMPVLIQELSAVTMEEDTGEEEEEEEEEDEEEEAE